MSQCPLPPWICYLIILCKLLMSKGLLAAEGKDSAVQTPDNKHFTGIYPLL